MRSALSTDKKTVILSTLFMLIYLSALTQENTLWSRYGVGDPVPSVNIVNRGMGYVAAAYSDQQTVNFSNPASYSYFGKQRAILDLGIDFQSRNTRDNTNEQSRFNNIIIPYLAAGFQLKGEKRKRNWGIAFGLRPVTRVSYNIETRGRFGGDSIINIYEGNGGTYQAFAGTAIGIKNFSIGMNWGYRFGSKDYASRVILINDTINNRYTSGQKEVKNNFGGVFGELGIQYQINISEKTKLNLGAFGSLSSKMNVISREKISTFLGSGTGSSDLLLDSVSSKDNISGQMIYPGYTGFGFTYERIAKSHLMIGADYTSQNWEAYRFFDQPDILANSWQIKTGVQWIPNAKSNSGKLTGMIIYRAGFIFSQEPFIQNGNVKSYGFTVGTGIPIKKYSYAEYNRNNIINLAFEFGRRGSSSNIIQENYLRLALSASLSDIWFIKSKYD
jgi:hypothetical protein